jgi:hypothetical protein
MSEQPWHATVTRTGRWHYMIALEGPRQGDYWTSCCAWGRTNADRKARRIVVRHNIEAQRQAESWTIEG